jgi:hypothetical protein
VWGRKGRLLLVPLTVLLMVQAAGAQTRIASTKGQSVSPAYEGWWPNEDGSFTMFFGYKNSNSEQEFDVPIGAATASNRAAPIRDSRRISIRAVTRSCSPSECRRISARKN